MCADDESFDASAVPHEPRRFLANNAPPPRLQFAVVHSSWWWLHLLRWLRPSEVDSRRPIRAPRISVDFVVADVLGDCCCQVSARLPSSSFATELTARRECIFRNWRSAHVTSGDVNRAIAVLRRHLGSRYIHHTVHAAFSEECTGVAIIELGSLNRPNVFRKPTMGVFLSTAQYSSRVIPSFRMR